MILVSGAVYRLTEKLSWAASVHDSISIVLGLPSISWVHAGTWPVVEKIIFILWFGFCAATLPPKSTLPLGSRRWNVFVALGSLWVVVLAVVSLFSLFFLDECEALGLSDGTNVRECLMLAAGTLFRVNYSGVPANSIGIWSIQVIEASIGLLLGLLALRVIYATASAPPGTSMTPR